MQSLSVPRSFGGLQPPSSMHHADRHQWRGQHTHTTHDNKEKKETQAHLLAEEEKEKNHIMVPFSPCSVPCPLSALPSRLLCPPSLLSVDACSLLTGDWSGSSLRIDSNSGLPIETIWSSTKLYFEGHSGKIHGEGMSYWGEQTIPFEIIGAFNQAMTQVELLKTHRAGVGNNAAGAGGGGGGSGGGGTVIHFACSLDVVNQTITGNFANGGSCTLQRMNGLTGSVPFQPQSQSQAPSQQQQQPQPQHQSQAPSHLQRSLSNPSTVPESPKDLLTFLSYCFTDSPGIAAKIHATLQENEIHDPESLTTLSHEEWREIGIVLGHRSKIKLQLQRFFPHLMKMQNEETNTSNNNTTTGGGGGGGGSSTSPTHSLNTNSNDPTAQSNPSYHSHPGLLSSVSSHPYVGLSSPPSHYVSASLYSSVPSSFTTSGVPGGTFPVTSIPLEYLCPITREVMDDPVLAADGHSYDRNSIQQWLETKKTSPITNKILGSKSLTPNLQLRKDIAQWRQNTQMQGSQPY